MDDLSTDDEWPCEISANQKTAGIEQEYILQN